MSNEHIHDENCNHNDEEFQTITLTLDNNKEIECYVVAIFEEDAQEYIALLPTEEDEVYLYRFKELEDGEIQLDNIDSEEEYKKASEIFMEIMEQEDFNEDYEDEDFDDE